MSRMAEDIFEISNRIAPLTLRRSSDLDGPETPPPEAYMSDRWIAPETHSKKASIAVIEAAEFIARYKPHTDVVQGMLRGEYVYALTAPTNAGKTALCVLLALCVATGRPFSGRKVRQGRVLYLCGENPYDVRPRLLAACRAAGIEPGELNGWLYVIEQAFPLRDNVEGLIAQLHTTEDGTDAPHWTMVLVDTSVAYFHGDREDDNVQSKDHALALRRLSRLAGNPVVVAACHPRKHATRDELEPRGGSALLNELDGNLVCWTDDGRLTLHWQRKLRQPPFEPMDFRLRGYELSEYQYDDGTVVETVIAESLTETEAETLERRSEERENRVLYEMLRQPQGGIRGWADGAGLTKSTVERILRGPLREFGLARKYRRQWTLTEAGKKEAERVN